jgi:hypothetical protein
MEIKLELDTEKTARAAVAIAAAYILGCVSVHLASPQLAAALSHSSSSLRSSTAHARLPKIPIKATIKFLG